MAKPSVTVRNKIMERARQEQETSEEGIPLTHKYRPRDMRSFAGQTSAIEVVRDAFSAKRIPRAWLIEGRTGTGKTSFARLISMRINCIGVTTGADPCGKCDSCKKYATYPAPTHPAHIEINASSERGIDDVRSLVQQSRLHTMTGQRRVILLDEPQGLTPQAQEAMLKPLEDPAGSTIWILSTTDPGKLKSTLIGRCRAGHLKIRPPTLAELGKRLAKIVKEEHATLDNKWLKRIVVACNYTPRDSISVLEQVLNAQRRKGGVDIKRMLPTIIDSVQSGNPDQVAMHVIGEILAGNPTEALRTANKSGMEAHLLLGGMIRVWDQTIKAIISRSLVDPYFSSSMFRIYADAGVDAGMEGISLSDLIRGGEYLARQYERAKNFIVPGSLVTTLVVTGLWDTCVPEDQAE